MRKAILTRIEFGDAGTFGTLITDSGYVCRTGELPWRDNAPNVSCIPEGTYTCRWRHSLKHGMCYHIDDVPGRTDVELHAANFMGDESKGLKCQLRGCIAPGAGVGEIDGQRAITGSRDALKKLEEDFDFEEFELTINGAEK